MIPVLTLCLIYLFSTGGVLIPGQYSEHSPKESAMLDYYVYAGIKEPERIQVTDFNSLFGIGFLIDWPKWPWLVL
jgi:hypothetical protein